MIDMNVVRQPPTVSAPMQKPIMLPSEPPLRYAGKIIPPDHPAYRIIKQIILKKYGMGKP